MKIKIDFIMQPKYSLISMEKQSGLYEATQKNYPVFPATLDDLVTEGDWAKTESGGRL